MDKKEIVLFTDGNVALEVPITPEQDTVWLNRWPNYLSVM